MNKKMMIERMAEKAGISKKEAAERLAIMLEVMTEGLKEFGEVNLTGFMKIHIVDTPAREGEMNGKKWSKPAGKTVKAKISSTLKKEVLG